MRGGEGTGTAECGAPGRGQETQRERWRDRDREQRSQRDGRRGPRPESRPRSPVDLVLLPPQAITVQAWGLGLGRPGWAIGPGGSRCRGHCLREASQGCSAVRDAWVVRQLIVLGGGERGRAPRRCQETSLSWRPGDASPCPQEPALSFPVSEPCHPGPRVSQGAVSLGPRALSQGLPSEIPGVWAGGSSGERLTPVSGLRVGGGVIKGLEGGEERALERSRESPEARCKTEAGVRKERQGGEEILERDGGGSHFP